MYFNFCFPRFDFCVIVPLFLVLSQIIYKISLKLKSERYGSIDGITRADGRKQKIVFNFGCFLVGWFGWANQSPAQLMLTYRNIDFSTKYPNQARIGKVCYLCRLLYPLINEFRHGQKTFI